MTGAIKIIFSSPGAAVCFASRLFSPRIAPINLTNQNIQVEGNIHYAMRSTAPLKGHELYIENYTYQSPTHIRAKQRTKYEYNGLGRDRNAQHQNMWEEFCTSFASLCASCLFVVKNCV